jgi:hypothetical protein
MNINLTTLDDQADPTFNQLLGINDFGRIAGYFGSGQPGHPNKGYTLTPDYDQNDYHNENFPGSAQTQVTGLNNFGLTVGFYVDANGNNLGFAEFDGNFLSVHDPAAPPLATSPNGTPSVEQLLGVNDFGTAVGFYTDAGGTNHGFTYNLFTGSFNQVNVAGFTNITAAATNDEGRIAGFGTYNGKTEGFVEDPNGHVAVIAGPSGATSVNVLGINNEDDAVGSWMDAQGNTHGFLYDLKSNQYTTIDACNKTMTVINGLNDNGQLVGFYVDAAGNTDGLLVSVKH